MFRPSFVLPPSPPRRGGKRTHDASENGAEWRHETFRFPFVGLDGRRFEVIHSLAYDPRTSAAWNAEILGLQVWLVDAVELAIKTHIEPILAARTSRGGTASQGGSNENDSPARDAQRATKRILTSNPRGPTLPEVRHHPPPLAHRTNQSDDKSCEVNIDSDAGGAGSPVKLAGGSVDDRDGHQAGVGPEPMDLSPTQTRGWVNPKISLIVRMESCTARRAGPPGLTSGRDGTEKVEEEYVGVSRQRGLAAVQQLGDLLRAGEGRLVDRERTGGDKRELL
ncbi:hypothetical protein RHOSPDRAFT_25729 [Rhodotorula sp. JG-1b]|nr:hypothetical protein RHOSPDRAFT_25729 [Rhodotorula sp. JG-1b]